MQTFLQWLEVVTRSPITSNQQLQIKFIDPEDDWEWAAQVETISRKVGIRSNRNKDVRIIALVGDQVIGGISDEIRQDEMGQVYDFDVVVDPQWQGYQNVGMKLIDAAIKNAYSTECNMIQVYVVNPRLSQILVSKYGFESTSKMSPAILYKML